MKCITCKGRGLCGRPVCPILRRLEKIAALPKVGRRLEGMSPPEVFVGLTDEERRLVVDGPDARGLLVEMNGLFLIAAGEGVAGVEIVGFKELGVEPDGGLEVGQGLLVVA
ncbi:MAG: hypothetical protein WCG94_05335, partial [Methanothrix sp.]